MTQFESKKPHIVNITFDVLIIGAGPSGLSAAIRLKQLSSDLNICVLEKSDVIGGHILSGAVFNPRVLNTLIPDWKNKDFPTHTPVTSEQFLYLTKKYSFKLPLPKPMKNKNNFIISLGAVCKWLAKEAESLGVEIYPGFAARKFSYDQNNQINGVITSQTQDVLHAKKIILAEGARGSLTQQICPNNKQTYGLGIKEIWEIKNNNISLGSVMHSVGWPLDQKTYGGSFLYYPEKNKLAIGFVVGLDYQNQTLDPFVEFQKFKTHPKIKKLLINSKRIAYGARVLNEGGYQSIPKNLNYQNTLIIGDSAGFLNVPEIKGIHPAMQSGVLAAESMINNTNYTQDIKNSWISKELYKSRNIRPGFKIFGLFFGLIYAFIDTYILKGKAPWTFKHNIDHKIKSLQSKPDSFKPDNQITFDKLSSVYLSNVHHPEHQDNHLKLTKHPAYHKILETLCPANVYNNGIIDSQNCLHCKACEIKDPEQNILWTVPDKGGPNYSEM